MSAAVTRCAPTPEIAAQLMAYFNPAAEQMRNDTGLPISSPGQARRG
jgi:truncated hemoglobin YjbI